MIKKISTAIFLIFLVSCIAQQSRDAIKSWDTLKTEFSSTKEINKERGDAILAAFTTFISSESRRKYNDLSISQVKYTRRIFNRFYQARLKGGIWEIKMQQRRIKMMALAFKIGKNSELVKPK